MIKYERRIPASGNAITQAAYTDFCSSCKYPTECTSQDDLAARFKAGTQYLRSVYKPGVNYPKHSYVVGDLYMAQQWFPLPVTATTAGMISHGANKLFEGLMLTLVGDGVRKWGEIDMINAYTKRKIQSYAGTGLEAA